MLSDHRYCQTRSRPSAIILVCFAIFQESVLHMQPMRGVRGKAWQHRQRHRHRYRGTKPTPGREKGQSVGFYNESFPFRSGRRATVHNIEEDAV